MAMGDKPLRIMPLLKLTDNDDWPTPQSLFDALDAEFGFTLDVCADESNHKCERYFDREKDGLSQDWTGERCFMNPPYGRAIGLWVKKAADASEAGTLVVGIVPARTDTRWWADHVTRASEVRLVTGRVHFGDKGPAPFGSAIVVWDGKGNGVPAFRMVKYRWIECGK